MLPITKIQNFCTKDGPGVRTTVFLKGCPLNCVWCHNPETHTNAHFYFNQKLCVGCGGCEDICEANVHSFSNGTHNVDRTLCVGCMRCARACPTDAIEGTVQWMSQDDIFDTVMKDKAFFGDIGGVTFSGGEPTLYASEIIPILNKFKQNGINTAIETCGYFDKEILSELVPAVDLFLWDIKDTDDLRHKQNTGVGTSEIIENLRLADSMGAKTVLRCILIKTVNLNDEHLQKIKDIYHSLKNCIGVEFIPYHTYGTSKRVQLGLSANENKAWIPTKEDIEKAQKECI